MKPCGVVASLALAALVGGACSCSSAVAGDPAFDPRVQELISKNGMSSNGLSVNGLSSNGMSSNGMSSNGLSSNGMSSNGLSSNGLSSNGLLAASFGTWWSSQDPVFSDMVMRYVTKCALPATSSLTFTDPTTAVVYTWPGLLGLAPTWASGQPIPVAEQQILTACLAAHANKYGVQIGISVLGLDSTGKVIPQAQGELTTYPFDEAAFFGNLFTGEGIFACADTILNSAQSSARGCALNASIQDPTFCPQLTYLGACGSRCKKATRTQAYWDSCTATPNGQTTAVTYRPLTTHIATVDIATCGDNICAISELPGTSKNAWNNCSDCATTSSTSTSTAK
jgi:GLTT repeat (6 copies)